MGEKTGSERKGNSFLYMVYDPVHMYRGYDKTDDFGITHDVVKAFRAVGILQGGIEGR